ncbi:hypothetical protein TNCT_175481 [Trichonephila clavata]|uniref:Uncharacterized protein n=1 Tax=Trichonephila clavata TaxID=2740835 RepID=A0A8X6HMT5_TRICU|nr:hypothetical protein TNCT_175481 [Trichonephila clavata]
MKTKWGFLSRPLTSLRVSSVSLRFFVRGSVGLFTLLMSFRLVETVGVQTYSVAGTGCGFLPTGACSRLFLSRVWNFLWIEVALFSSRLLLLGYPATLWGCRQASAYQCSLKPLFHASRSWTLFRYSRQLYIHRLTGGGVLWWYLSKPVTASVQE